MIERRLFACRLGSAVGVEMPSVSGCESLPKALRLPIRRIACKSWAASWTRISLLETVSACDLALILVHEYLLRPKIESSWEMSRE